MEEVNEKIKKNTDLIKLVGQLKYLDLKLINSKIKCLSFWLNCFNYLLLFTIFYRKWNLNKKEEWKSFFQYVKFKIGGINFTFNDMQYIIFKKPSFLASSYKRPDTIKEYKIKNMAGDIKFNDYIKYIPFLLYLPISGFLGPSLYDEINFGKQVNKRIKEYLFKFFKINQTNNIEYNELLLDFNKNIFDKELNNYEMFFRKGLYEYIKNKKYKGKFIIKKSWNITFENLISIEDDKDKK